MCVFMFVLLGFYSWICKLIIFTNFENFWTLLFPYFFCYPLTLLSLWHSSHGCKTTWYYSSGHQGSVLIVGHFFLLCVSFFVFVCFF